jgi:hypothetical protein
MHMIVPEIEHQYHTHMKCKRSLFLFEGSSQAAINGNTICRLIFASVFSDLARLPLYLATIMHRHIYAHDQSMLDTPFFWEHLPLKSRASYSLTTIASYTEQKSFKLIKLCIKSQQSFKSFLCIFNIPNGIGACQATTDQQYFWKQTDERQRNLTPLVHSKT